MGEMAWVMSERTRKLPQEAEREPSEWHSTVITGQAGASELATLTAHLVALRSTHCFAPWGIREGFASLITPSAETRNGNGGEEMNIEASDGQVVGRTC